MWHWGLRSPHCIEQLVVVLSRYSKTIEQASDYWRILSIATVTGIADVMFMWQHWGALIALPAPVSTASVWKRFLKQKIHLLSHCDRSSSLSLASLERDKNRNSLSHQAPGAGLISRAHIPDDEDLGAVYVMQNKSMGCRILIRHLWTAQPNAR